MPHLPHVRGLFAGGGSVVVRGVATDGEIVGTRADEEGPEERADEVGPEEERGVSGLGQTSSCTSTERVMCLWSPTITRQMR